MPAPKLSKRLLMTFDTIANKEITLTVDDPKSSIQKEDIKKVMDLIVEKGVFEPSGCLLTASKEAKIVTTDTTEYKLV